MTCPTPSKQAHPDRAAAVRHVRALRRVGGSVDLKPYRCDCGAYHTAMSRASLRRRIYRVLSGQRRWA